MFCITTLIYVLLCFYSKPFTVAIYGGEEAGIGEFPWLVYLKSGQSNKFVCGGSLINSRYVLTAGHCVTDRSNIVSVRLGEHNVKTDVDCDGSKYCSDPPVDVEVEEVILHEGYNEDDSYIQVDIALLRLKKKINYTKFIQPINLPLSPELRNKSFSGVTVVVAGWGRTNTTISSNGIKLKVKLPVISNHDCNHFYGKNNGHIAGSQICAGGEKGKDFCGGDSGGPLMYLNKKAEEENLVVIGIVSYQSTRCGSDHFPGVYTRVTEYLEWILDKMKS
ncbi:hypothetical protein ILUMI_05478 [Ignelater luminosus]|uniref:limulus clotting factor C n=1 Tax=Ignelater luminosus TaxID=2038154 RepID=A0A8K0DCH0_IGNLU|nr:hypothetical protein ILUMI_05478 [Ignelater luminosus]